MLEKDQKERSCLRCGNSFKSEWAGNRICNKCKSSMSYRNARATSTIKIELNRNKEEC